MRLPTATLLPITLILLHASNVIPAPTSSVGTFPDIRNGHHYLVRRPSNGDQHSNRYRELYQCLKDTVAGDTALPDFRASIKKINDCVLKKKKPGMTTIELVRASESCFKLKHLKSKSDLNNLKPELDLNDFYFSILEVSALGDKRPKPPSGKIPESLMTPEMAIVKIRRLMTQRIEGIITSWTEAINNFRDVIGKTRRSSDPGLIGYISNTLRRSPSQEVMNKQVTFINHLLNQNPPRTPTSAHDFAGLYLQDLRSCSEDSNIHSCLSTMLNGMKQNRIEHEKYLKGKEKQIEGQLMEMGKFLLPTFSMKAYAPK
ncbi:hypothetical protein BJ684DRAFT_14834 [Piptocephalis cylindrospora]|uniref:Uncharacterized protein n=1 Tax=Piptocephalis cylindrospora TaxID=1907219 RepID=A0A4P9Y7W3_9FUNG|nr:hypothetical protein BJ684DRAFT_14834 [Piptocephalis cylindrospora]|eukprot:RKP14872.1 hypothetical protein BJ684DRAFT_14834 [Piptocephalis cylindrospora]